MTDRLNEALKLSEEILKNVELSETPLSNIALKAGRLARLLDDAVYQQVFHYEATGYPTTPDGYPPEVFELLRISGRVVIKRDDSEKRNSIEIGNKEFAHWVSIENIENTIRANELALSAAQDPDISLSSANPDQYVVPPIGNRNERQTLIGTINIFTSYLSISKGLIYNYAKNKYYELKYSNIASDIFSRLRGNVDARIGEIIPDSIEKLSSVYENLHSDNPEDWSNAVHSCRRIILDLADALFPPQDGRVIKTGGKEKTIKLGKENYKNRLLAYISDKSSSGRFQELVGSQIEYMADRLDGLVEATNKGTHDTISTKEEADRYVIYTYMIVGDILSL